MGKEVYTRIKTFNNIQALEKSSYFIDLVNNKNMSAEIIDDKKRLMYTLLSPSGTFEELLPPQLLSIRNMIVEELTSKQWLVRIFDIMTKMYNIKNEWNEKYESGIRCIENDKVICNHQTCDECLNWYTCDHCDPKTIECIYCCNYFHIECVGIQLADFEEKFSRQDLVYFCNTCTNTILNDNDNMRKQYKDDIHTFRVWLDILTKLTNVHNRIQATIRLRKPSNNPLSYRTVSKLINRGVRKNNVFCLDRLFFMDKVGLSSNVSQKMPITVPLGPFLSFFYAMYVTYVSIPNPDLNVFDDLKENVNKNSIQIQTSKEIFKQWNPYIKGGSHYMEFVRTELKIPDWIFSRQHYLRTIGTCALATYHHFDRTVLEYVAHLSRHDVDVLIESYLPLYNIAREQDDPDKNYYYTSLPSIDEYVSTIIPEPMMRMVREIFTLPTYDDNNNNISESYEEWDGSGFTIAQNDDGNMKYTIVKNNFIPLCRECHSRLKVQNKEVYTRENYAYVILRCEKHRNNKSFIMRHEIPDNYNNIVQWIQTDDRTILGGGRHVRQNNRNVRRNNDNDNINISNIINSTCSYALPDNYVYVGIDVSKNCVSVCCMVRENNDTKLPKIHYFLRQPMGITITTRLRDDVVISKYQYDSNKTYVQMIQDMINKSYSRHGQHVHIAMEGVIDKSNTKHVKRFSGEHADFVHDIYNELNEVETYTVHVFDPSKIASAWRRKISTPMDNFEFDKKINEIVDELKDNMTSNNKKNSSAISKLLKYIFWLMRELPVLNHVELKTIVEAWEYNRITDKNRILSNVSKHPFSDIVDSFIIAKYLYDMMLLRSAN